MALVKITASVSKRSYAKYGRDSQVRQIVAEANDVLRQNDQMHASALTLTTKASGHGYVTQTLGFQLTSGSR